jgi:hypothetical protein
MAWGLVGLLLFGSLAGCWSNVKKGYSNPKFPISKVSSIAIMPFTGVAGADIAADTLAMVLTSKGLFENVVDRTQIQAILVEHNIQPALLDEKSLLHKGNLINADAFMTGSVSRFIQGVPNYPVATQSEVAMSLRLVSTETGQIIWTQVYSKQSFGRGLMAPNPADLVVEMVEELVEDLEELKRKP